MYNIVAPYAEISGSMKSLWPSKFELYFECDKCVHGMELPIKWDDKEYKLRTEKESKLATDVCATIQVVGRFELKVDLSVGVGQGIVWKTHLNDKTEPEEFRTNVNSDWVKMKQNEESEAYAFDLKLHVIKLLV
ncbi:unnamed protein product [Lactuca saligna]|uniref:Uncharacterized protein n=1 Tax=Lactuca saligna TaxID=75948 RepID=A0AA36E5R2_LACSI|nr:unnamed protein product [Lactuca saligna]